MVPVIGLCTTIFQFAQFDVERQLFSRKVGGCTSAIFINDSCLLDESYRWGSVFKIAAYPKSSSVLTDFSASQAFFLKVDLGFVLLDARGFHLHF